MSSFARRARAIASGLALFVAVTPLSSAHAQDATTTPAPKKPKKKKKPKTAPPPPTPAPVDTTPPPTPAAVEPTPPPAPAPTPTSAPVAPTEATPEGESMTDVYEKPSETYYFIGLRYRATVIPSFMLHLFADGGQTIVSNSIGVQLDVRRDGFSMIPWLIYQEYGTGDMLFHQKGEPDADQYYSQVNSSLKSIYIGTDLLWSKDLSKNLSFEYGAGFGLGFIFGSLVNNWVYDSGATGLLTGSNGHHYTPCSATDGEPACSASEHQNSTVNKVGGYVEKNWFGGGSVPVFFPHISFPELGLRYKPIKQLETRLQVGFSLTGFFLQLSGSYGLEEAMADKKEAPEKAPPPAETPVENPETK
jgi:hypothetical protein